MQQPTSARESYERGRGCRQAHKFEQAIEEFRRAATDPRLAGKAHVQLALCFRSLGRNEEAVAAFRQALDTGSFTATENAHLLYQLGRTLESLCRYAEALQAYGWARNEDPSLVDAESRIKHLLSGGRGPVPRQRKQAGTWVGEMLRLGREHTPHLTSLLDQTWKTLSQYVDTIQPVPGATGNSSGTSRATQSLPIRPQAPQPPRPSVDQARRGNTRHHIRVAVRLQSHFSVKGRRVAGDGELRDLSPGGCRVTSFVAVPVGAELECSIFPQNGINPFTVEGATVRWSRNLEFGLAFTSVRPGVQKQIAQLCRPRTALGLTV